MIKRLTTLLCLLLVGLTAIAQEETPVPTSNTQTFGILQITLPEGWFASEGQGGTIVFANVDVNTVSEEDFTESTILGQATLGKITEVQTVLEKEEVTVQDLVELIAGNPEIEITVTDVTGAEIASAYVQDGDFTYAVYARFLEDSFVFAVARGASEDTLRESDALLSGIVTDFALNIEVFVPEDALVRYAEIPQSTTEEGFPLLGDPDAPVKVVEVGSFDCSHCKTFHDVGFVALFELIERGSVAFIYVPIYGTGGIPNGEAAARAAVCAQEQGAFWAFHDVLFAAQSYGASAFLPERLQEGIKSLDLDEEAYLACIDSETTTQVLTSAVDFAYAIPEFRGTPTVLVNDVLTSWQPLEGFLLKISEALPQ